MRRGHALHLTVLSTAVQCIGWARSEAQSATCGNCCNYFATAVSFFWIPIQYQRVWVRDRLITRSTCHSSWNHLALAGTFSGGEREVWLLARNWQSSAIASYVKGLVNEGPPWQSAFDSFVLHCAMRSVNRQWTVAIPLPNSPIVHWRKVSSTFSA